MGKCNCRWRAGGIVARHTTVYHLPGETAYLIELTAVLENDPAMGAMVLGMVPIFVLINP